MIPYNVVDQMRTFTESNNAVSRYTYDKVGNLEIEKYPYLKQEVNPSTQDRSNAVVTSVTYNAKGQVKTITDPEGSTQSYDYDKNQCQRLNSYLHL